MTERQTCFYDCIELIVINQLVSKQIGHAQNTQALILIFYKNNVSCKKIPTRGLPINLSHSCYMILVGERTRLGDQRNVKTCFRDSIPRIIVSRA